MSTCSGNCEGCASKGNCSEEKHEPLLKNVKKAVLVLSGKGGVGKSTVAASLAVTLAKMGKKNGCLIEGMACPGGCVAGAGTNIAVPQATKEVNNFKAHSEKKIPEMEENHD